MSGRTALQQEVIGAILDSKAVNFDAVGGILSKFGERAARDGDELVFSVHWWVIDWCIPPYRLVKDQGERVVVAQVDAREVGGQVRS